MGEAVEIRVHGVGGTPPQHLLGEASPDSVVRIGGSGESAFYRRTSDHTGKLEGYAWGPLTSKGLLQPLWILLLPFTLANVAGWMIPARGDARSEGWWKLSRRLVLSLAALLTVGYAFGISIIVVKQIFYQWGSTWSWWILDWLADQPRFRVALGGMVSAGAGSLFTHMARRTQRGFEAVNGPIGNPSSPDDVSLLQFRVQGPSRVDIDQDFRDEEFWSRSRRARTLLKTHWILWIAAVLLFTTVAFSHAQPRIVPPELGLTVLFTSLGWLQVGLLIALLATLFVGFHRPVRIFVTGHFRVFGPCIMFSTAISLAAGFFSALATVTGRALQGASSDNDVLPLGGPEYDLDVAFGVGTMTFALCVVGLVALRLIQGKKIAKEITETNEPPVNTAGSFDMPNGVPDHKVGGLGRTRALALAIRKADLALSIPALPFAIIALWTLLSMSGVTTHPRNVDCFGKVDCLAWLDGTGGALTVFGVTTLAGVLLHGYFKDSQRRTIGIVWDVLTFWPRRFHPLAVRPYAERAVPELQCRIVKHLRKDPDARVILSAHSQGSILAYASLVQLAEHRPDVATRVCLVTYGSPLTRLHSCFFPAFFEPVGFRQLQEKLCSGSVTIAGENVPLAWRNFYRLTDYIGQRVELAPLPLGTPDPDINVEVNDPASTPPGVDAAYFARPDPLRPAWVELVLHSDYNSEIELKEWNERVRRALG